MLELDPTCGQAPGGWNGSYSSIFALGNPMDREAVAYGPWGLKSAGMSTGMFTHVSSVQHKKSIQPPSCFGQQWNNLVTLSCGLKKDFNLRLITMQTSHVISELVHQLTISVLVQKQCPQWPKWTHSLGRHGLPALFLEVPAIWPDPPSPRL